MTCSVGELVQTYADAAVLEEGKVDYARVAPILFDFQRIKYWSLGEEIGTPWNDRKKS